MFLSDILGGYSLGARRFLDFNVCKSDPVFFSNRNTSFCIAVDCRLFILRLSFCMDEILWTVA